MKNRRNHRRCCYLMKRLAENPSLPKMPKNRENEKGKSLDFRRKIVTFRRNQMKDGGNHGF